MSWWLRQLWRLAVWLERYLRARLAKTDAGWATIGSLVVSSDRKPVYFRADGSLYMKLDHEYHVQVQQRNDVLLQAAPEEPFDPRELVRPI